MRDRGLYIFYLIFWICGRVYIFADDYYHVKIFHSIGLHFDILCLLAYIRHISKEKAFWTAFFIYELVGMGTFMKVQLSIDNSAVAALWNVGVRNSALSKISKNLGVFQDLFIPIFIFIFIAVCRKLSGKKSNGY